jgi:hypothetical protein
MLHSLMQHTCSHNLKSMRKFLLLLQWLLYDNILKNIRRKFLLSRMRVIENICLNISKASDAFSAKTNSSAPLPCVHPAKYTARLVRGRVY